jgi:hypothetical protein
VKLALKLGEAKTGAFLKNYPADGLLKLAEYIRAGIEEPVRARIARRGGIPPGTD